MNAAMRKRILPMPVHLVVGHPAMLTAKSVCYNITLSLCVIYWISGCNDLPDSPSDLIQLARSSAVAWSRVADDVKAALRDLLPMLRDARESRLAFAARLRLAQVKARSARMSLPPALRPPMPQQRKAQHLARLAAGGVTVAENAAYTALQAQGINLRRRLTADELRQGITVDGISLTIVPLNNASPAHPASGQAVGRSGGQTLDDTGTIPPDGRPGARKPAKPLKPNGVLRDTGKR